MKKVLLTGATGFVGGRLAIQLIKEGYQVKALVRDPSRANDLAKAGVELVSGDVTDLQSIEHSLDGVEGIFHLAAIYDFGVDPEKMRQVNIEGTRNILDAAQRARINRIVYCGSDTSLGNTHGKLCDETKTHDGNHFCSAYEETKHLAHRLVIQRIQEGAPIINAIVSTVYGPGDKSAIGEFIELHLAGQLSMALDREAGYTFAHVDDVARALLLAYEKGTLGQSYLISGTPATFGELFDTMSSLTGIDSPKQMPKWALKFVPILIPLVGFLIGKSRAALRELFAMGQNVTRFFSGEKARQMLGWQPRSLQVGLAQTLAWYQKKDLKIAEKSLYGFARWILIGLCLFDISLGGQALFLQNRYIDMIHPHFQELHVQGPTYWLSRIGMLWLFFAIVEGLAALNPRRYIMLVYLTGMLRLMDVPADLVYCYLSDDLGHFGIFALLFSPAFNLISGLYLIHCAKRAIRAGLASYRNANSLTNEAES